MTTSPLLINPNPSTDFLSIGSYGPAVAPMFGQAVDPVKSYLTTPGNVAPNLATPDVPGVTTIPGVNAPIVAAPTTTTSAVSPTAPSTSGLGFNTGTMGLLLGGIQTIGNLWNAWEQNKLAREQFKFSKDITNQNLANQMQSYNTNLQTVADLRASTEGWSGQDARQYVKDNKLNRQ